MHIQVGSYNVHTMHYIICKVCHAGFERDIYIHTYTIAYLLCEAYDTLCIHTNISSAAQAQLSALTACITL